MASTTTTQLDRTVELRGVLGGVLAIIVSVVMMVTLPLRGVDYNALNLFTIILGAIAGSLAIVGARRADGRGLGRGLGLLVVAVLPTVFGWVCLLYLPAVILLAAATARFVTTRP